MRPPSPSKLHVFGRIDGACYIVSPSSPTYWGATFSFAVWGVRHIRIFISIIPNSQVIFWPCHYNSPSSERLSGWACSYSMGIRIQRLGGSDVIFQAPYCIRQHYARLESGARASGVKTFSISQIPLLPKWISCRTPLFLDQRCEHQMRFGNGIKVNSKHLNTSLCLHLMT